MDSTNINIENSRIENSRNENSRIENSRNGSINGRTFEHYIHDNLLQLFENNNYIKVYNENEVSNFARILYNVELRKIDHFIKIFDKYYIAIQTKTGKNINEDDVILFMNNIKIINDNTPLQCLCVIYISRDKNIHMQYKYKKLFHISNYQNNVELWNKLVNILIENLANINIPICNKNTQIKIQNQQELQRYLEIPSVLSHYENKLDKTIVEYIYIFLKIKNNVFLFTKNITKYFPLFLFFIIKISKIYLSGKLFAKYLIILQKKIKLLKCKYFTTDIKYINRLNIGASILFAGLIEYYI